MLAVADSENPGEYSRANDVLSVSQQSATRCQQEDRDDGEYGMRTTTDAKGGRKGDTLAPREFERHCSGEGHARSATCKYPEDIA
jgi:hypothetical protein